VACCPAKHILSEGIQKICNAGPSILKSRKLC
jgi:hypothetical protein